MQDRTGSLTRVEPVTMTIACVEDRNGEFGHIGRVNAVAAELKRFGKKQPGSIVVRERRDSFLIGEVEVSMSNGFDGEGQ